MQKISELKLAEYTKGEEILSVATHAAGAVFGVAILIKMLFDTVGKEPALSVFACVVYGISVIAVFTVSSIYHSLKPGFAKRVMRIIDHCTIYLVIAGCYTPAVLCKAYNYIPTASVTAFIILWLAALLGVLLNVIDMKKYTAASMVLYLLCGWCFIFVLPLLIYKIGFGGFIDYMGGAQGLLLLGGGAVSLTAGALLYALVKKKYMHGVYHICIDIGMVFLYLFLDYSVIHG